MFSGNVAAARVRHALWRRCRTIACAVLLVLMTAPAIAADAADIEALRAEALAAIDADRKDEALAKAQRAMTIAQERFGPEHPEVAQSLELIAALSDDPAAVESGMRGAIAMYEAAYGPNHESIAAALMTLTYLKAFSADSETLLKRALAIREAIHQSGDRRIGQTLAALQGFYVIHGRMAEAEAIGARLSGSKAPHP